MSLKMDSSVIWVGQISAECHFKIENDDLDPVEFAGSKALEYNIDITYFLINESDRPNSGSFKLAQLRAPQILTNNNNLIIHVWRTCGCCNNYNPLPPPNFELVLTCCNNILCAGSATGHHKSRKERKSAM